MDEVFVIANNFLALLHLSIKEVQYIPTLPIVKVIKAQSVGELALITLVSKGTVAARA